MRARAGNPLLDISSNVPAELLAKYGLKLNNAILAGPEHAELYAELVRDFPVEYIAGGATQNSIRVAQWMSGNQPGFAAYIGAVGDDEFARQLRAAAEKDGVTPYYHVAAVPTGTCAVLVHDKERSLVANLSAAEKYAAEHFASPAVAAALEGGRIFYSAGFFLTHSAGVMAAMGKAAAAAPGKVYCMNLSAPFLCAFFKEQMHSVLPYCDFVFGNESEAAAYGEANGLPAGASVSDVALAIAALPKASGTRARVVVITQGSDATVVAQDGAVRSLPVDKVDPASIVDTNGAGDAFVGGFLAFLAKGASVDECVRAGHFAAGHVITQSGCKFNAELTYKA